MTLAWRLSPRLVYVLFAASLCMASIHVDVIHAYHVYIYTTGAHELLLPWEGEGVPRMDSRLQHLSRTTVCELVWHCPFEFAMQLQKKNLR